MSAGGLARRGRGLALGAALAFGLPGVARAMPPGADGRALRDAATALAEVRVAESGRILERLAARYPNDPDVRFERAMYRFTRGDYAGAVADLDAAGDRSALRSGGDRETLAALIRATHEATSSYVSAASTDGRYVVRHAPGPDAVLVPYALEAMRAADRALTTALGVEVPGPLRLEVYPTAASLARVSSLTVEDIETTGTIALCKWDRIMVTSPRALVRGYPWLDTVGHELVHLFLSRASRDRAPVWLQEGVAKFYERTWRGEPPGAHLHPAEEALLQEAAHADRLLSFDRLHPSIARLPSQRDAALAFAQVATFVEAFHGAEGSDGLRRAVRAIARGQDAREALADVAGRAWSSLEGAWRDALAERPDPATPPPELLQRQLRVAGVEGDESSEVADDQARRHLRLGDLLWDRQRPAAAAVEYGEAHGRVPDDPIVASRLARAALAGGDPRRAVDALAPFRERYPEHAPTWSVSGSAWRQLGEVAEARGALVEALRLNPFDPQPHCDLAEIATTDEERRRERDACRQLGGPRR